MRRKGIVAAAVLLVGLLGAFAWRGGEDLGAGVTKAAIRRVQVGMTEGDVLNTLGQPLGVTNDATRDVRTLEYSRPVRGARWYPMLWVHLRDGRVREVYAKRYVLWGLDDEGVYGMSREGASETGEFESTFPR